MAIDNLVNNSLRKFGFKIHHSGNGLSARSDVTCHNYGKKCHIKREYRP